MTCPCFIDRYGDLRQGTKSSLMAKLAVYITYQPVSDVEIADRNTLLYHIAWPQNCTVSVIAESMDSRLRSGTTNYHPPLAYELHSGLHSRHENKSRGAPPTRKPFLNSSRNVPWDKGLK